MASNQYIADALIRHQVYLRRYAASAGNDVADLLEKLANEIAKLIGNSNTEFQVGQLRRIQAALPEMLKKLDISAQLQQSADDLVAAEVDYFEKLLGKATTANIVNTSPEVLASTLSSKPMLLTSTAGRVQALTAAQMVAAFAAGQQKQITSQLRAGIALGKTNEQLAKEIRQKAKNLTRAQSLAVARTLTNHYAAEARRFATIANKDIFKGEKYVATLDSRTTFICASLDGQVFAIDKGPQPPLHYNAIPGGERVTTLQGFKKIENIKPGEYVLTHRGRYRKVLSTMNKINESGVVRVFCNKAGMTTRMTDEHPVLVNQVGWKRADNVALGDQLFYHTNNTVKSFFRPVIHTNPENYPSLFDGEEVFIDVVGNSACVSSPINLYNKFKLIASEIPYTISEYKLPFWSYSIFNKAIKKFKLFDRGVFKKVLSQACKSFGSSIRAVGRVISLHPVRMVTVHLARFFCKPIGPVGAPSPNASSNPLKSCALLGLSFWHIINTVLITPISQSIIAKAKLSLYSPKWLSKINVVLKDKTCKFFSIFKIHKFSSFVVSDITTVAHIGKVYNLEVEEDQSYIVSGVVVHNCRSLRSPIVRDKYNIPGLEGRRPAVSLTKDMKRDISTVSNKTKFEGWFDGQPDHFKLDYLGPGRYQLYKDGKVKLEGFTDDNGRVYTLKELYAMPT